MNLGELVERLQGLIDKGVPKETLITLLENGSITLSSDKPVTVAKGEFSDSKSSGIWYRPGAKFTGEFVLIGDLDHFQSARPNQTITNLETGQTVELPYEYPDPIYD